ncbi:putative 1-phosphatidylinositol 3-phosphate 5-kinase isoform X2 [Wyeomyia smithii]|uniref:putative 1-phosphatidylinositol 3-phosphate 5-kinase isoform X2 n=1 Tax=Wyeomyia smithii TaxID=174621 RepID=UPI002467E60C|nr:putative 1-phosphatidylinositol 3-phosphate 5-kinase isoform X2 [Wyeomyia smithii]
MNKNLHSPKILTEFARDFEEEPSTLFNKLVKLTASIYNSGSETSSNDNHNVENKTSPINNVHEEKQESLNNVQTQLSNQVPCYGPSFVHERTSINVLKRLSNIVSQRSTSYQNYKHTELQKLWMPDSTSIECYDCSAKFSTFRRKHHCRLCGQIFCTKCCNQVVPGKLINCTGDLKVCTYCSKVVLTYLKSSNITADLKSDLKALQDDLSNKLSSNSFCNPNDGDTYTITSQRRKVSVGYQEERFVSTQTTTMSSADRKSILQQSSSLRALYEEMIKVLPNVNRGLNLTSYLINTQKSSNNRQALAILNAMTEAGFLIPLLVDTTQFSYTEPESEEASSFIVFDENLEYKFLWHDDQVSQSGSYELDVDFKSNSVHIMRPNIIDAHEPVTNMTPSSAQAGTQLCSNYRDTDVDSSFLYSSGAKPLLEAFCEHEELLLNQLLRNECLDTTWAKTLIPIAARVTNTIRPQISGLVDTMDIRNHVFFKKVPGGQRHDCKIIGGVVFSKNVVHRQMLSCVDKPRILLLQCAIAYQRIEGKFVSFDTLMLQERDYLKNKITKILSLGPNIILVHKNVAGIAQDMLRNNGVTVVLDVKLCVMERIARCLECDILTSIDSNVGQPKLGTCDTFHIQTFSDEQGNCKSLMCFEKSHSPRGCCVLLRGGSRSELVKIKKVISLLLFARYNWRLELSYLCDVYARPPSPRPNFFDTEEACTTDECSGPLKNLMHGVSNIRKEEDVTRKTNVNFESVGDFSDPLRAIDLSQNILDSENSLDLMVDTTIDNRFKTALSSTILSISPFMNIPLPYLETVSGQKCALRSRFPSELFYSKYLSDRMPDKLVLLDIPMKQQEELVKLLPIHEFISHKIRSAVDSREIQVMLADYRASGGRYFKQATMGNGSSRSQCAITCHQKSLDEYIYKDALHLESHQRLPVLFCSFYYNLNAPSSFCAQPSFLNMQFYGHNDIMLGEFLERYCFRSTYICKSCNVPMMDHVRRYVHSQGCVQVKLSEDVNKLDTGTILVTSKCNICNEITTPTPMSNDTWCYSFAKYLESRFHGHAYKCRGLKNHTNCKHSLHRDHTQYFSYMGLVASFAYNPVEMWEIHLPTMIVQLIPPKITCNTKQIVEDVKNFAITGYEIYAKIFDKLAYLSEDTDSFAKLKKKANQDQMGFKQNVEVIQTLLTEPNVPADEIENAMLLLKKSLAETTDEWEPKLQEIMVQTRSNQTKLDLANVDSGTIVTEDFTSSIEDSSTTDKTLSETFISEEGKSDELMFESITEGNKIDDKPTKDFERKGAKSLFSQLLSSNDLTHVLNSPLPANEHYNIKTGLFPVMVDDQDVSSCIAYSLVSREYLKALDNLYSETATDSSPNLMRKSLDIGLVTETDDLNQIKLESGEIKKNKQSYIEIHFQDSVTNFVCKVYFAKEFDQLRNNLLKQPITKSEDVRYKQTDMHKKPNDTRKNEDNKDLPGSMFARSFCKSIKWEARGGKSGSKFSKTMDDQFVLKEMSKTDISLFENFAPNYFDYLQQCLSKDQPTLLVKIFGVFKVAIRRKDFTSVEKTVLVMENLFSNKDISDKFDLKGSLRNRMVDPNRQTGEIVLMDENLMQMSWTNPLYIFTHSRTILKEAIEQDASFLEKNGVMDYSLLVGLDNKKHLLVVGIIDYIRTFTLDKRVESIIKQSGIMGGHGKLPTVVSPKMYRTRFSEAMDRYFLAVPDRWEGLTKHSLLEYT